ncbi:MAG: amidase [Burkholderiaceae bacterium]|nr:amidase [Burkholderiaceae bacterium]
MSTQLHHLTALELQHQYRSKNLSPVELARHVIDLVALVQRKHNCFLALCPDQAIAEAKESEKVIMAGGDYPPLTGIPFTVKDLVNTKGVKTTFGALPFKDNIPTEDALIVKRMRDAGAILLGKTTTPEFGTAGFTESPLFGKTSNAWDASRTSGGSSGGAAVSIACGVGPLAVATDGGGSTRIPAACNGVVGIKQSSGIVPHSQVVDKFGNQTYVTPMTRTVADTALMLDVISGGDACDPTSIGLIKQHFLSSLHERKDLKGIKFLYCLVPDSFPIESDVQASFESALIKLSELGAEVEAFDPSGLNVLDTWHVINHTVWLTRFAALAEKNREQLSDTFLKQLDSAKSYSAMDYQLAMNARSQLFERIQLLVKPDTYLVMPTITKTALPIDLDFLGAMQIAGQNVTNIRAHWYPWTMLFNMTGHPAISIPCGFGLDGLPIGLHLVGQYRKDADLLQVVQLIESTFSLNHRWPAGI